MRRLFDKLLALRRMTLLAIVTLATTIALSLGAGGGLRPAYVQAAQTPLLMAVTPNLSDPIQPPPWAALAAHISQRSGRLLRIVQPASLAEFEACLAVNAYDLVLAFPHQVSVLKHDDRPALARLRSQPRALIVVRSDDTRYGLADLGDTSMAYPANGGLAETTLATLEANARHGDLTSHAVANAGAAYHAVLSGTATAAAGSVTSFNALPEQIRARLRVIHQTERYAPASVHARRPVSDHVRQRLTEAFGSVRRASPVLFSKSRFFDFVESDGQPSTLTVPSKRHVRRSAPDNDQSCPTT